MSKGEIDYILHGLEEMYKAEEKDNDILLKSISLISGLKGLIDYIYDAHDYARDDERSVLNKIYGEAYKSGRCMGIEDIIDFMENTIIYNDEVIMGM